MVVLVLVWPFLVLEEVEGVVLVLEEVEGVVLLKCLATNIRR